MIFGESKVLVETGYKEARLLRAGDNVLSWMKDRWKRNRVMKVIQGKAKTANSVFCFDGVETMRLRCTDTKMKAGRTALVSEGVHVFRAQIGATSLEVLPEAETTFSF